MAVLYRLALTFTRRVISFRVMVTAASVCTSVSAACTAVADVSAAVRAFTRQAGRIRQQRSKEEFEMGRV